MWEVVNEAMIKKNWGKTIIRLSNMLYRVRRGWEEVSVRPNWIDKEVFD